MKILRFIFPFLFVRNWYDGAWEFSTTRFMIFLGFCTLIFFALIIMHMLYMPVEYTATHSS